MRNPLQTAQRLIMAIRSLSLSLSLSLIIELACIWFDKLLLSSEYTTSSCIILRPF